jgi:hypothetical protein
MKKLLLAAFIFCISSAAYSQALTLPGSFVSHVTTAQSMSQADINTNISKISFENYRLKDQKVTLTFDNGFAIVLLSATEAQALGLISNAASYPAAFDPKFKLPVFHMTPDGKVSAAYPVNSKYSSNNR